jgi:cardiolipin synthase A/B
MKIILPLWVAIFAAVAILALVLIVWSVKRRRQPRLRLESGAGLDDLLLSIVGITQSTLTQGNRVELLQNGAFFDALFRDIENAQRSINFETFLAKHGKVTAKLSDLLIDRALNGVQVHLMLDGNGGRRFGHMDLVRLKNAGVRIAHYHPIRLSNLGILNNRDHRKIVVIDGRIGYIGGHCLVDSWCGEAEDKKHYRDISARVEGPVVAQLQSAFAENWVEESGEVIGGERYFPPLEPVGDMPAHLAWLSPTGSPSTLKLLHYMAIHAAEKSITIQNPYFLPDPLARDTLVDAARRGVNVRVMIPATDASDNAIVQHASHHHYGTLLKGGVKLYDYQRTLLHQKVIVIDSCWAAIGSTNFDDRSFELNDEVSLAVYDEGIARELETTFERDLAHAKEVHLEPWAKRPLLHKLTDFGAFLFNEQL